MRERTHALKYTNGLSRTTVNVLRVRAQLTLAQLTLARQWVYPKSVVSPVKREHEVVAC